MQQFLASDMFTDMLRSAVRDLNLRIWASRHGAEVDLARLLALHERLNEACLPKPSRRRLWTRMPVPRRQQRATG